jgi:NitT/TauT family transport system substrate-binding protein
MKVGVIFLKKIIIIIACLCLIILGIVCFINKNNRNEEFKEVKLAEVTHSVFYAPLYAAIENGYFEDEGIKIELILTSGADKVSAAILSNTVDVGFAGPESAIYVYKNNEKDYLITFAGLTKRDGQFIVGREKIDNFNISDLYGKSILTGRSSGMPALNFFNGVKNVNGDLNKININTSIDFASLSGTFISGTGDFVNLFDINVTKRKQKKTTNVVLSIII